MGFNIGGAISGAISGAASGFLMGGPWGAAAGGALGGAAGGFGVGGGGPSSIGGITGPGGGAKAGTEARGYYDEAFPGTNAWERLGAGNPIGPIAAAGVNAKVAARNADVVTRQQAMSVATQAAASVKVAKINAAGAANVATIHSVPAAASAAAATTAAGTGVARVPLEERRTKVEEDRLVYQREHSDASVAKMFANVTNATAAGIKLKAFRLGSRGRMGEAFLYKHRKAIFAAGVGKEELEAFANAAGIIGGAAAVRAILSGSRFMKGFRGKAPKRTSVRPLGKALTPAPMPFSRRISPPGSGMVN